jgi:hypothetical protein
MKALRNKLAALLVLGAIAVLTAPAPAGADIIQRPIYMPEGGAGGAELGGDGYRTPPVAPENPNPPDPSGGDLIMMTLVWLGVL